jgi:hypothetical protein
MQRTRHGEWWLSVSWNELYSSSLVLHKAQPTQLQLRSCPASYAATRPSVQPIRNRAGLELELSLLSFAELYSCTPSTAYGVCCHVSSVLLLITAFSPASLSVRRTGCVLRSTLMISHSCRAGWGRCRPARGGQAHQPALVDRRQLGPRLPRLFRACGLACARTLLTVARLAPSCSAASCGEKPS